MNRLLAESAPLARQWAQETCRHDAAVGESCAWYHGAWQTLRLIGIVTTLTHHAALYIQALRPLIAAGDVRRVLISGAADYGLLAVVLDAVGREGGRPDVAVVDHCGTPLRLCRWYAERFSLGIHTVQCDLAAFRSSDMHDVICAHSLLSCVPVQRHAAIVESWYRLLRPGGILMMANTLYPGTSETKVRFSPEQVAAYGKRVSAAAASCPHPEALPPDRELDRMAEAFGARLSASVVSSQEQLTGLLRGGGFELLEARFGELVKDPHYRRTGPPAATQKEQAWIVARRA